MISIDSLLSSTIKTSRLSFIYQNKNMLGTVLSVQDILDHSERINNPHIPIHIRGAINMKGRISPIMDIHQYCGEQSQAFDAKRVAVILLKDDDLESIIRSLTGHANDEDQASQASSTGKNDLNISKDVITGIAIIEYQMVLLMDADKLQEKGLFDPSLFSSKQVSQDQSVEV